MQSPETHATTVLTDEDREFIAHAARVLGGRPAAKLIGISPQALGAATMGSARRGTVALVVAALPGLRAAVETRIAQGGSRRR